MATVMTSKEQRKRRNMWEAYEMRNDWIQVICRFCCFFRDQFF